MPYKVVYADTGAAEKRRITRGRRPNLSSSLEICDARKGRMRIAGVHDEAPAARAWGCVHTGRWRPRLDRLPASSEANS